jgi:hypothetical protein
MTISQIEAKIQELETWLIKNPNSPERGLIESDLKKLQTNLIKTYDKPNN